MQDSPTNIPTPLDFVANVFHRRGFASFKQRTKILHYKMLTSDQLPVGSIVYLPPWGELRAPSLETLCNFSPQKDAFDHPIVVLSKDVGTGRVSVLIVRLSIFLYSASNLR